MALWDSAFEWALLAGLVVLAVVAYLTLRRRDQHNRALLAFIADSVNRLPDGVARFGADEKLIYCNKTYVDLNRVIADLCVPGTAFAALARAKVERDWQGGPEEDREQYLAKRVATFRAGAREWEEEYEDGSWVLARDHPTDDGGRVCLRLDITARKTMEMAQAHTLANLSAVLLSIDYGVVFMDRELRVLLMNRAFQEMWGVPASMLDTRPTMPDIMRAIRNTGTYPMSDAAFDKLLAERTAAVRAGAIAPQDILRTDGRTFRFQCVALADGERMLTYYDITEQKRNEATIRQMAERDHLTSLVGLRLAQEILDKSIASARRHGATCSVMFIDLDGFKAVNDNHGHDAGDQLLQQVAARLSQCVRESDTVARIGGDEFLIIQQDVHNREVCTRVAGAVIASLRQPFEVEGIQLAVGASIGIALYPDHALGAKQLIKAADGAMYQVKRAGKGNFDFVDASCAEQAATLNFDV